MSLFSSVFPFCCESSLPFLGKFWPRFTFFLFLLVFPRKWGLFVSSMWWGRQEEGSRPSAWAASVLAFVPESFRDSTGASCQKEARLLHSAWYLLDAMFGMNPKFSRRRREGNSFLTLGHSQLLLGILEFNYPYCYLSLCNCNCWLIVIKSIESFKIQPRPLA